MFDFLKKMFRKKKVEEVQKVSPVIGDLDEEYKTVKGLRPTLTNNQGKLSVSGLTSKPAPKATPSYYGHHHSPRSSYLPTSQTFQPHPNPVVYDDHDSITGSNDSLLVGVLVGVLADEAVHAVSKSVETSHHTPPPEPVHVTPSNSYNEYSSPSKSSEDYSRVTDTPSWGTTDSSDYTSSADASSGWGGD